VVFGTARVAVPPTFCVRTPPGVKKVQVMLTATEIRFAATAGVCGFSRQNLEVSPSYGRNRVAAWSNNAVVA
jgi:hypothetical protein